MSRFTKTATKSSRSNPFTHTLLPVVAGLTMGLSAGLGSAASSADGWKPFEELTQRELVQVRRETFELDNANLAISGYDPVSYFPEGGSKPAKGKKKHTFQHNGVVYRFASQANLDRFKANPEKFEPAYGGWCAYAMAHGSYTEPNPKRYTIQDGRLMLFYTSWVTDTHDNWFEEGPQQLEADADEFWGEQLQKEADAFE